MHVVDRLRFEVRCSSEQQAFEVRHNVAHAIQRLAIEAIDDVCNAVAGEHEWLQIERIEIDLGELSAASLERDFSTLFRRRFEDELLKQRRERAAGVRALSKERARFALFAHLADHGALPWWGEGDEADLDALAQELALQAPDAMRAFLQDQRSNPRVWHRLAFQLGDVAALRVIALLDLLSAAHDSAMERLSHALTKSDAPLNPSTDAFNAAIVQTRSALLYHAPDVLSAGPGSARASEAIDVAVRHGAAAYQRGEHISRLADSHGAGVSDTTPTFTSVGTLRPDGSEAVQPNGTLTAASEDRHIVRHAGIVLLAPFFPRFFATCELLEESQWRSKAAQYEAVHLLACLCTGAGRHPEHDLTFHKLCCGLPIDQPVPRDVDLPAAHLAECEKLLASVIEHWKALKNTSIAGLRDTFLRRDGIITRTEDADWQLRIERKTLDVLIDQLPWGYSIVAMPWNPYRIHVEW